MLAFIFGLFIWGYLGMLLLLLAISLSIGVLLIGIELLRALMGACAERVLTLTKSRLLRGRDR